MQAVRIAEAFRLVGLGRSTGFNHVKAGTFPRPFPVSSNAKAVLRHELDALLAARARGASEDEVRELVARLHEARKASAGAAA